MQPTWQEDYEALHKERQILIGNLRLLHENASKAGQKSIATNNQIIDNRQRLQEVEKELFEIQNTYENEISQNSALHRLVEPARYSDRSYNFPAADDQAPEKPRKGLYFFIAGGVTLIAVVIAVIWWAVSTTQHKAGDTVIPIQSGYVHIGDSNNSNFHSPPQPGPFVKEFLVPGPASSFYLSLIAADVNPNVDQSPVKVSVNGTFLTYLNTYFKEENFTPKEVQIPIPNSLIRAGTNEVRIEEQPSSAKYGLIDLDDFEISELTLHIQNP